MGMNTPTASPFPTPISSRPAATRSIFLCSSLKVSPRTSPVSDSPMIAGRSLASECAQRSTQLQTRFMRPPMNQVAHGTPREVSRTFS